MERLRALVQTADLTGRPPRGSQSPLRLHTQKQVQVDTVPEQPALFVGPRDIPWDAAGWNPKVRAPGTKKHRPAGWAGPGDLTSWPSSRTTLKSEAEENGTDSSLFSHHLP